MTDNSFVRNIALDLVLTLITFGLFSLRVNYCQMRTLNHMLKEEKYSFLIWILLTMITFGLYHIYHEYRKSMDISKILNEPHSNEPILSVILTIFGFWIVADAIQQSRINQYFGNAGL